MILQLAKAVSGARFSAKNSGNQINVNPDNSVAGILDHTQVYCLFLDPLNGATSVHILDSKNKRTKTAAYPAQKSGLGRYAVQMLGILHTQLDTQTENSYIYNIGVNAGKDFRSGLGAKIKVTFLVEPPATPGTPTPPEESCFIPYTPPASANNYLTRLADNRAAYQHIQIEVLKNEEPETKSDFPDLFERGIYLHVFDTAGNLLGLTYKEKMKNAATQDKEGYALINGNYIIPYQPGGILIGAFIEPIKHLIFKQWSWKIGDPRTDATVTVSEA
ncbi:MAG: hypothetical protein ACK4TA_11210 [Saprospiraceae bacterium]